jgi:formamidopyrimidine-DNA glycosylase
VPELPDITVYLEALGKRISGQTIQRVELASPFLLRTVDPPLAEAEGKSVTGLRRIGKRIAIGAGHDIWLVLHLMIAGRLHWIAPGKKAGKQSLAVFEFSSGALTLTEAGSQKRASLHVVRGEEGLSTLDPGGLEVLDSDFSAFDARLRSANHTLKRALTDPRLFSGIGNAYSDEILHRAALSPTALTQRLSETDSHRLFEGVRGVLNEWIQRLRAEAGSAFPEGVTAFRPDMAVHGRYGKPCPRCSAPVQRIRYAGNETNYCPRCQTGGRLLADRSLSRLLRQDWPKTLEELELLPGRLGRR